MRSFGSQAVLLILVAAASACEGPAGAGGTPCAVTGGDGGTTVITCPGSPPVMISNGTAASCSVSSDDAGVRTIHCSDGTMATVTSGTPCTVVDNGDGTKTITCPGSDPVTINDGHNGEPCTVTDNADGSKTVSCPGSDPVTIANGASCSVVDNGNGTNTITCEDGTVATVANGAAGAAGGNVEIPNFHGTDRLLQIGEYENGAKSLVDVTISSATADAAGLVTVGFAVATREATPSPVTTLTAASANIAKLMPAAGGDASTQWVDYIYRTQTVTAGSWPGPAGTSATQATSESSGTDPGQGTLTNNHDGTYTYVFAANLMSAMRGDAPVGYDRTLTHRVSIMIGGHAGPTGTATFDFVPDGSAITTTRDIVQTATCQHCHGQEFHGHGGNRLTVENCVTCHNPGNYDPNGATAAGFPGETIDARVMIHRIHAGSSLATIPGPDGQVFDDPATTADESADNGSYAIWGYRDTKFEWSRVGFPAEIENCTACHQGSGAQVENWRTNPSRAACGSCHNDVDFATGTNHPGGRQMNDMGCVTCHPSEGTGIGQSVTSAHDFRGNDPRLAPEFSIATTVSTPRNGTHFVDGESPIVTIVLTNRATGAVVNHTTVAEDATVEGCTLPGPCPAGDGLFTTAAILVSGPRGRRTGVLTTAARAQVFASGAGPFDLSAAGASLMLKVDGGADVHGTNASGGDTVLAGSITVAVPATGTAFANRAAATLAEIAAWLNADANFRARAIAYVEGGRLGLRSRNLGPVHSIQLATSAVTTAVFAADVTVHMPPGTYPTNNISARTTPANNDPKATRTAGSITYALDPVDDLEPGTYVVVTEFADAGSVRGTENYRVTSVGSATFQVGTATEQPLVARNCGTCHVGATGTGLVMHNLALLNDHAVDECGTCHDYQPRDATGWDWTGAVPISRRVHGVHRGAHLNYPNATVHHADAPAGRNWDIEFPQDIRNCEVCHTAETSGTWRTAAARIPCMGCHDSDAAAGHFRAMTYDPTPADAWSGDEIESCPTCHAARD